MVGGPLGGILTVLLAIVLGAIALAAGVFVFVKLFGLVWKILGNVFRFIGAEVADAVRLIGVVIAAPIFALLVVLNILIGRWSASGHFGRAFGSECHTFGACVYRLVVANPLNLLGLGGVLEGIEQRVPQAMAEAPGRDKPKRAVGMFDGYTIVGSLKGGGSGGKLYIAEPDELKKAALSRRGCADVDRVVIKVFSQKDGSTLDQILRESRALEAARRMGLVLEHDSSPDRFYYVMRYVPGESLGTLTHRMHAQSAPGGLDDKHLREAMGYLADLLAALETYHQGGLWHKDVKPDNIIIDQPGTSSAKAHLVDLGLVTPMRSAMTLTTHGTEFFRDPELVRQALRGVKVHQIDGAKFDVYSAAAVSFSVIENSFPAHGGLSQITKRCPDALRWVIRRGMAEYDSRYPTAAAMLGDLAFIRAASDPFALKPADLPSMKGESVAFVPPPIPEAFVVQSAATPVPPRAPEPAAGERQRGAPKLTITDWWTGRYSADGGRPPAAPVSPTPPPPARAARALRPAGERLPAHQQVDRARERARVRRNRAQSRLSGNRKRLATGVRRHESSSRWGTAGALVFALVVGTLAVAAFINVVEHATPGETSVVVSTDGVTHAEASVGNGVVSAVSTVTSEDHLDARVLVVSDMPVPMDPETESAVRGTLNDLAQAGVDVTGDLTGDDDVIDVVAKARRDRGSTPLMNESMSELLAPLFESEGFDAVVWIEPVREGEGGQRYVVITPTMRASSTMHGAPASGSLLRLLKHVQD